MYLYPEVVLLTNQTNMAFTTHGLRRKIGREHAEKMIGPFWRMMEIGRCIK